MKLSKNHTFAALAVALLFQTSIIWATPIGTVFSYQGALKFNGSPAANGLYDFRFTLKDAAANGSTVGSAVTTNAVPVTNGLFTVHLDFGAAAFTSGEARWLQLEVNTNLITPLISLGRQPLTPAPQAIYASSAGTAAIANGVAAGSVTSASLAPGSVGATAIADSSIGTADLSPAVLNNTFWKLGGNGGTTLGANFLGTTDNKALQLKVNGVIALQINPGATLPNIVGGLGASRPSVIGSGVSGAVIAGGNAPSGNVSGAGFLDFQAVYDNDGTVGGGFGNKVGSDDGNVADAAFGTVAGGVFNAATSYAATVAGGDNNLADGQHAAILGGSANVARGAASAVGGGLQNTIQLGADSATIGGGQGNSILTNASSATIGGGEMNTAASRATVGGGSENRASGGNATIGGGERNAASGTTATVGGGYANRANAFRATVSGGELNTTDGIAAAIGGGDNNAASGYASVIGGGEFNRVTGDWGTVPGGLRNEATNSAFAAGRQAKAVHSGAFVWADSTGADFASTADNQFSIRAQGGVRLSEDTPNLSFGSQTRQMLNLWGSQYGIGVQSDTLYFRSDATLNGGFIWYKGGVHDEGYSQPGLGGTEMMHLLSDKLYVQGGVVVDQAGLNNGLVTSYGLTFGTSSGEGIASKRTVGGNRFGLDFYAGGLNRMTILNNGNVGINTTVPDSSLTVNGTASKPGGGSWSFFSDERLKKNIRPLTGVLEKVLALRGVNFEYKEPEKIHELSGERTGLIAQEVEKVFPDWVETGANGYKRLTVRGFEALTVEALRDLRAEKDAELQNLRTRLEKLEQLINR